jgi:hypothetical protein
MELTASCSRVASVDSEVFRKVCVTNPTLTIYGRPTVNPFFVMCLVCPRAIARNLHQLELLAGPRSPGRHVW